MTVREQLRQLHKLGWEVRVIGATIFDSPKGITRLASHWKKIEQSKSKIVRVNDSPLVHNLVKTRSTQRSEMTAAEEAVWYQAYTKLLDDFKPDVVYYYGGRTLDLLIGDEARARGIPVAAYLANGNYRGTRWCRDVDLVITNSKATANFYQQQDGIESKTIGPFVNPDMVVATKRDPKHVVAINPSLAKGAAIIAAVAVHLEHNRPDITFEIIESRGDWDAVVTAVQAQYGHESRPLKNVVVTPNQSDMRHVYSRTKILLVLSLWWESLPRVAIEAMLNGIPCIGTNHGGVPEAIDRAGIIVSMPSVCHRPPYNHLPDNEKILEVADSIVSLCDDDATRIPLEQAAREQARDYSLKSRGSYLSRLFNNLNIVRHISGKTRETERKRNIHGRKWKGNGETKGGISQNFSKLQLFCAVANLNFNSGIVNTDTGQLAERALPETIRSRFFKPTARQTGINHSDYKPLHRKNLTNRCGEPNETGSRPILYLTDHAMDNERDSLCSMSEDFNFTPAANDSYRLPSKQAIHYEMRVAKAKLGYVPNIRKPTTFNENIIQRKLCGRAPISAHLLADKLAVRDYVREIVGSEVLPRILQIYDDPAQVSVTALPADFVIKSNHANGQVLKSTVVKKMDASQLQHRLTQWLQRTYGIESNEYWYQAISPRLYTEETLHPETGQTLDDLKFFVLNRRCFCIQVDQDRDTNHKRVLYDRHWRPCEFGLKYPIGRASPPPRQLNQMIELSEALAPNNDIYRIDLYLTDHGVKFGEITLAPGAGWEQFYYPSSYKLDYRAADEKMYMLALEQTDDSLAKQH